MNKSENTKNQLIEAVIELLQECDDVSEVTSRKITERAKINLATINYHFKSKDELVNIAINQLIGDAAYSYIEDIKNSNQIPREKLRNFLVRFSDVAVQYRKYMKETILYALLQDKFTQTVEILPFVRECFNRDKNDKECKIIAYELVAFMQIVFYRADDFKKFSNIDIMDKSERDRLIDMQLDLLIK